jgi:hypothetical protein
MFSRALSFTTGSFVLAALLAPAATTTTTTPTQTVTINKALTATTRMTTAAIPTAHFTVNLRASYTAAGSMGFNVFDLAGSTTNPAGLKTKLAALPAGSRAMIYVGALGKSAGAQGFTRAQFQAQVNALATDKRVFGYYIADEPHPILVPSVVAEIAARADYLRARAPLQKSFIVVLDGTNLCHGTLGCEYAALAPSRSHVDIIGVDVYPCQLRAPCAFNKIPQRVNAAIRAGIPRARIAPVYQAFGQEGGANPYYRTPTAAELQTMLATWKASVPAPLLDYAYSWGTQSTAPQALSNHPALQSVVRTHNAG